LLIIANLALLKFGYESCLAIEIHQITLAETMADQESTDHDGSRVDHGVVRPPTLVEDRCIKYVPARLLSNPLMYFLTAYLITNEGIGEYF
jgi:hypothetical protein